MKKFVLLTGRRTGVQRRRQFRRPTARAPLPSVHESRSGQPMALQRLRAAQFIEANIAVFVPACWGQFSGAESLSTSFSGLQLARLGAFGAFGSCSLRKCNIEPSSQEICPRRDPGKVRVGVSSLACAASFCHSSASSLARSRAVWMCRQPASCGRPARTCQRNMALISTCEAN
ncbi:hypothetical protein K505DRAFT_74849 [Melanomma pulvis-pyrius CBS 109.77]|uniref:Uncharacterized protein n=1 Tax=Melanomma pulvis-pyrius CBS 109.77 TaxID=1314802 RepID=A0A6A6X3C0_9PLEO|nr:hypothetical protein K505DRAFT_74849 [Melanomma pulvis-pyrius CBS 109.77]